MEYVRFALKFTTLTALLVTLSRLIASPATVVDKRLGTEVPISVGEGFDMDIDFDSKIGILTDFEPGTFFATRTDQRPIFGMAAVYGGSPVAILFNLAVQPSEPFPSMVQAQFLGGQDLIGLMGAYLAPSLSQSGMEFNSAQRDGPGSLIMTEDGTFMRVARRAEGFFYLDVGVGSVASSRPSGIEIPRWSVRILDKGGAALKLFEFDGPNPL